MIHMIQLLCYINHINVVARDLFVATREIGWGDIYRGYTLVGDVVTAATQIVNKCSVVAA